MCVPNEELRCVPTGERCIPTEVLSAYQLWTFNVYQQGNGVYQQGNLTKPNQKIRLSSFDIVKYYKPSHRLLPCVRMLFVLVPGCP
ncbi:hypothetical protein DPMN_187941 [Dreissena polymorpha]|uniref:Uncharacterized protein n=1 Tax=Dreissena polymorpha TaxID=45954 RepID=A0A9D4DPZ6_DREPO|nr:hypothetical protein DPMN_187941 [Dreissena polymorpha]